VDQRVEQHNGDDRRAARYTRARRPVTLVYREFAGRRSAAARREYEIKSLPRQKKLELVAEAEPG